MGKSLQDFIIPAALGATGFGLAGMGPMAGLFSGGAGLAGGAGVAGDALAAQGASGLLGSAGASAAGYGAPSLLGNAAAATLPADFMGSTGINGLDSLMANSTSEALAGAGKGFMGDGLSIGNTIGADGMTLNSATGGYDSLNGMERLIQRGGFALDGMSGSDQLGMAQKGLSMMNGGQQPQQAPKSVQQNIQRSPSQPASYGSPSSFSANTNQVYPNFGVENVANIEAEKRKQFMAQFGQSPNFRR